MIPWIFLTWACKMYFPLNEFGHMSHFQDLILWLWPQWSSKRESEANLSSQTWHKNWLSNELVSWICNCNLVIVTNFLEHFAHWNFFSVCVFPTCCSRAPWLVNPLGQFSHMYFRSFKCTPCKKRTCLNINVTEWGTVA